MKRIIGFSLFVILFASIMNSCSDKNEGLNTPPSIVDQSFSIEENSENGTVVGQVVASNLEEEQTLSFSIIGGDPNNIFSIDSNTGVITVNNSELLDFESIPLFELGVEVADNGEEPAYNAATISITVLDVAESIYIDITQNICGGKDATISSLEPNINYDKTDIDIYAWTSGGQLIVNRFLIDFAFDKIPSGAIIDSAYISLFYNVNWSSPHSGNNQFFIERVTSTWDESSVTWNNQPETTTVNQFAYNLVTEGTDNLTRLDITLLVRDIVNNLDNSFGLMFKLQSEEVYKLLKFASSEHPDASLHPKLEVYYTPN